MLCEGDEVVVLRNWGSRESVAVAQKRRNPYGKYVQIYASALILLP
jgi:hypothetical protein